MSTTCFGLYGRRQVGYNIRRKLHNIIWHKTNISVVLVEGRDLVYKDLEGVCAEGVVYGRFIRCHVSSVTS